MNCLCCGKSLQDKGYQGWHKRCIEHFFATTELPKLEFVGRFPELFLFYRLFSPLYSEMICIFPYFCPYTESARE